MTDSSDQDQLKSVTGKLDTLLACDQENSAERMCEGVVGVARRFVTFDIATFCCYDFDPQISDKVLVLCRYATDNETRFYWPNRWLKVKSVPIQSLRGVTFVISEFKPDELETDPVIELYKSKSVRYLLSVLYWIDGKLVASLTYARRQESDIVDSGKGPFNDGDRAILQAVGMTNLDFHRDLTRDFH
jgi:hypothetical protein